MKKTIQQLGKKLTKNEQTSITGGIALNSQCSGPIFLCAVDACDIEGARCAFPSPTGGILSGTIRNGVCCS